MNLALFGGTFDPIHSGHLRVARRAMAEFGLDRILFVPSGNPPHKPDADLAPFVHRFAMVVLACASESRFIPSLLETPTTDGSPHYSVDTARRLRQRLGLQDRLYFLIGVDAFLEIRQWKDYRDLFNLVNFIVVTRPGFEAREISTVLPEDVLATGGRPLPGSEDTRSLRQSSVHMLRGVRVPLASREIRDALRRGERITGFVPALVEKYMVKEGLYRPDGLDTLA